MKYATLVSIFLKFFGLIYCIRVQFIKICKKNHQNYYPYIREMALFWAANFSVMFQSFSRNCFFPRKQHHQYTRKICFFPSKNSALSGFEKIFWKNIHYLARSGHETVWCSSLFLLISNVYHLILRKSCAKSRKIVIFSRYWQQSKSKRFQNVGRKKTARKTAKKTRNIQSPKPRSKASH